MRPHPPIFRILILTGALCVLPSPALAAVDYAVRVDAPAPLAALLAEHLSLVTDRKDPDMDEALLDAMVRDTPEEAVKLLETEGYFAAQVRVDTEPGKTRGYVVKVEPGHAATVADVTIRLTGPIHGEEDFQGRYAAVLEAWTLPIGAPFRQSDWEDGKKATLRLLLVDRFPMARIAHSRALVDPVTRKVDLDVELDSGPRVEFGALAIKGLERYPPSVARGLADFREGDPYRLDKLLAYQSALEQSPHFSTAIVSANLQRFSDGKVPVEVDLTEFPRQKLELGLNYGTDVGLGTRIGYEHYNIFRRGYTGSLVYDWKKSEQQFSLGLGLPRQSDGYAHSATYAYKRTDTNNVIELSHSAGLWRTRSRGKIEARLGLEYLADSQKVAGNTTINRALIPSFGWTRRSVDNPLRPRSGLLIDSKLSGTIGGALSNTSFVRGYLKATAYWTPFPGWGTWVGRTELGQVWANDTDQVPSSLLFKAGGSNSVRGYDYQALGVPGPDNSVLGGRVLATASVEYQIPVMRDWALALFTDVGDASQSWKSYRSRHGNGVGVRWMSPVAPLSFDIAKGDKLRWYLSLGLAF
ncbi:autotransporter assembly complex protein TamA [Paludibacterium paludis]|uniref:Membrane protein n=1 Tax=Paludibacterium paludis TaxID=1225769 RepID=A0A918P345_9NEIS|nr:autotransporter assembly complex family protein [Paludibacterium paludis]GGY15830.1 membrane protein [Paludibacterium paludis]